MQCWGGSWAQDADQTESGWTGSGVRHTARFAQRMRMAFVNGPLHTGVLNGYGLATAASDNNVVVDRHILERFSMAGGGK